MARTTRSRSGVVRDYNDDGKLVAETEPCYCEGVYIGQWMTNYQKNGEYAGSMFFPVSPDDPTNVDPRKPAKRETAARKSVSIERQVRNGQRVA